MTAEKLVHFRRGFHVDTEDIFGTLMGYQMNNKEEIEIEAVSGSIPPKWLTF